MFLPHLRFSAFINSSFKRRCFREKRAAFSNIYYKDSNTPFSPMFSSFFLLPSSVLLVSTVTASALPSPPNLILSSSNVPATVIAINTSQQVLESSASSYSTECSVSYGSFLNYASCQDALTKISRATLPLTFGQRGTRNWDVVLPRRYLSGMLFPSLS